MGYPTRIQQIRRKQSSQWYINIPAALANAMEFQKGEIVEWVIRENVGLVLVRQKPEEAKKKLPPGKRAMSSRDKDGKTKER